MNILRVTQVADVHRHGELGDLHGESIHQGQRAPEMLGNAAKPKPGWRKFTPGQRTFKEYSFRDDGAIVHFCVTWLTLHIQTLFITKSLFNQEREPE